MNKAFTREADGEDGEEDDLDPALRLPVGTKNYMTPGGYARMRSEFDQLMNKDRPHMVEVVAWAASNGDRSVGGYK